MRFNKKFVSYLLVFAMMLTGIQVFANETETAQNNTPPQTYSDNVALLTALGIYSFGDAAYNDTVTRSQFARMAMELINMEDTALGEGEAYFSDVTADTPYRQEIHTAAFMSIMNGMGDTTFRPLSHITYGQAIKVLVSALGYRPMADSTGGYMNGYLRCAASIGLLDGSTENFDAALTFEMAVKLIKRAAETEVFEVVGISEGQSVFSSSEDRLAMGVYHNIYKETGQMTDNGITALDGITRVGPEDVMIDGKICSGASYQAKQLLGCKVTYYYRDDAGTNTLLYAAAEPNKNDIVTIHADDLLPDDASFSKTCLVAKINGKKKSLGIYVYADLIYNGSADATFTAETMKIKSGEIRLIDSNHDGKYETVLVEEYKDILIASSSVYEEKVFAKYAPGADYSAIDYGKYKNVVIEDKDGNALAASDLTENAVVSVFCSKDDRKIRFVVSKESKEITVSAISEEEHTVMHDGENSFPLSDTYEALCAAGNSAFPTPKLGSMYKIYINFEGYIAALDELQGRTQYAYLLGIQRGKGLQQKDVMLKLFLESNDSIVVNAAKKITVNQVRGQQPASLMDSSVKLVDAEGAVQPQLVKVTINAKGELTELETAQNDTPYFSKTYSETSSRGDIYSFDLNRMSLVYHDKIEEAGVTVYAAQNARVLNGGYAIDKNTKLFMIANSDISLTTTDEEDIRAVSYAEFNRIYSRVNIKLYDADENWICGAGVFGPVMYENTRTFTVESSSMISDEYGDRKLKVSGWYKNNFWNFREYSDGVFADAVRAAGYSDGNVRPGDVFQISFASDGISIAMAQLLYSPLRFDPDISFYAALNQPTTPIVATETWVLGTPLTKGNGNVGIKVDKKLTDAAVGDLGNYANDVKYFPNYFYTANFVLKFDCETKKLTRSSADEIPVMASVNAAGDGFEEPFDGNTKVFLIRSRGMVYDTLIVTGLNSLR